MKNGTIILISCVVFLGGGVVGFRIKPKGADKQLFESIRVELNEQRLKNNQLASTIESLREDRERTKHRIEELENTELLYEETYRRLQELRTAIRKSNNGIRGDLATLGEIIQSDRDLIERIRASIESGED